MFSAAVLITCHNRREKTLRCLESLRVARERADVQVDVFLVDDGSTDGTGQAVKEFFALHSNSNLTLQLIQGTGDLFWAKGMALAWSEALKFESANHSTTTTFNYNYFLWLNDDVILFEDALSILMEDASRRFGIVVGSCCHSDDHQRLTYGILGRWFNGNVVLIPAEIASAVGIISSDYSHARADNDYAERVRRAGFSFFASSRFVGTCRNETEKKLEGKTLPQRLMMLVRPSNWNLHDLWLFQSRYNGWLHACLSCAHLVLIAVLYKGNRKGHS